MASPSEAKGDVVVQESSVVVDVNRPAGTVIHVKKKHGLLRDAVPVMPMGFAVVFCVLNFIAPGIGTILSAFTVFCCGETATNKGRCTDFWLNIASGFLQLITFPLIVGWIWSINTGTTFVTLATEYKFTKSLKAGARERKK